MVYNQNSRMENSVHTDQEASEHAADPDLHCFFFFFFFLNGHKHAQHNKDLEVSII